MGQTLPHQSRAHRSQAPLLGDLTSLYTVDEDGFAGHFPASRGDPHKLPSIVGGFHDKAGYHLVLSCYLILDEVADVGTGGPKLGEYPLVAFAVRLLAWKLLVVAEEVRSEQLV